MGQFFYGALAAPITLSDELLAYVRLIVGAKLRNNESFMLSWHHEGEDTGDRSSAWLHPAIAVRFVFDRPSRTEIDPAKLAQLHTAANSASGLVLPAKSADAAETEVAAVTTLQRGVLRGATATASAGTARRSA